jgi:hypothetical protein
MKMGMNYGASKTAPPKGSVKDVNVKESRLNKGGDTAFKGKRGAKKGY